MAKNAAAPKSFRHVAIRESAERIEVVLVAQNLVVFTAYAVTPATRAAADRAAVRAEVVVAKGLH